MTIIPEDKDWTWVLQRTCPDCRFDASTFDRNAAPREIRDIAERWVEVLRREGVGDRPRADVWSPLEYGCHVRDVFRIFDGRLALMLTEHDPIFANWDQDATAVEERYSEQDPIAVAADLARFAEVLAARAATVDGDQWSRPSRRSNGSTFTVDTFMRYLLHDPIHHLWDVGA